MLATASKGVSSTSGWEGVNSGVTSDADVAAEIFSLGADAAGVFFFVILSLFDPSEIKYLKRRNCTPKAEFSAAFL
jgi:hypothetical protein